MKSTLVLGLCLSVPLALAAQTNRTDSVKVVEAYGRLPLTFEANQGQSDAQVKYRSLGAGYSLFLTSNEAVLALQPSAASPSSRRAEMATPAPAPVRIKLLHANSKVEVSGEDELSGKSNYFVGNDPGKWQANVRQYAKVRYENVYPGVDLIYYGQQQELEFDFVLQPGANPGAIRLGIAGATKLRLEHGDLVMTSAAGDMRLRAPHIYQKAKGGRTEVRGGYVIKGKNEVEFQLAAYDRRRALVIDPVLGFSTFLGAGSNIAGYNNRGYGIAVDSAGNAYVTGFTDSAFFPVGRALQPALDGEYDAFVTKFNADGGFVYSTYLGGNDADFGEAIAVDSAGNVYLTGVTDSTDFPTKNPIQATYAGDGDAFVTKISADGSAIVYSTYLGTSSFDEGTAIAVDSLGNAYVTGLVTSAGFPTKNAIQPNYAGGDDVFVAKINPSGSAFVYSTYLGGSGGDESGTEIAVDSKGNAYVTGSTSSSDFPIKNALQPTYGGGPADAFVTKINPNGSAFIYSTYLGGSDRDVGAGIAVDSAGNAYVTGSTTSADFPVKNPIVPIFVGPFDAFVTKMNAAGSALVYSTYGYGSTGIGLDSARDAFVLGGTSVTEINAAGNAVVFSTLLSGSGDDFGGGIAVTSTGVAYIVGTTSSPNFPTTLLAFQKHKNGNYDAFVAKLAAQTFLSLSPANVVFPKQVIGTTVTKTVTVTNQGAGNLTINKIYNPSFTSSNFGQTNNCSILAPNTNCTISVTFTPTGQGKSSDRIAISDSDPGSPQTVGLIGYSTAVSLSPTHLSFAKQAVGTTSASQNIILTNAGDGPLNFTGLSVTGINAGDFSETNTCGTSIPAQSSCTITVRFKPTAIGTRKALVTINDSAYGSPQNVNLVGTGT